MMNPTLTLEELSRQTGVEGRTLRSWITAGLLSPPLKPGRGAVYPSSNVDRALAVRTLQSMHGAALSDIRQWFLTASPKDIRAVARGSGAAITWPPQSKSSARDYLASLRESDTRKPSSSMSEDLEDPIWNHGKVEDPYRRNSPHRVRQAEIAHVERLILQLGQVLEAPAPRRSRGKIWTRIDVTPDLEISVRGDLAPHERLLFEELADHLRAILMGGDRNVGK